MANFEINYFFFIFFFRAAAAQQQGKDHRSNEKINNQEKRRGREKKIPTIPLPAKQRQRNHNKIVSTKERQEEKRISVENEKKKNPIRPKISDTRAVWMSSIRQVEFFFLLRFLLNVFVRCYSFIYTHPRIERGLQTVVYVCALV